MAALGPRLIMTVNTKLLGIYTVAWDWGRISFPRLLQLPNKGVRSGDGNPSLYLRLCSQEIPSETRSDKKRVSKDGTMIRKETQLARHLREFNGE